MVKVGDTVKWEAGSKGMLSGKVTGGEKGKRWRIEKGGKRYYVEKDKVKKGVVKKSEKKKVAKGTHTMPDGTVMTGKTHTKDSKPVAKKSVDKDALQKVMGVMTEVAKSKGKSTKKEVDSKVALDKKAEKGKLTQKAFLDFIETSDKYMTKWDDMKGQNIDDRHEVQGYSMGYYIAKVSKRADSWEELTDNQINRLQTIMDNEAYREQRQHIKQEFDESIKGKKFKSIDDAVKTFFEEIGY